MSELMYADESELKQQLIDLLADDFEISEEAEGRFMLDRSAVRIDLVIRPKPHLIERGFDDLVIGVEVKCIRPAASHLMKKRALQAAWQAITYRFSTVDSERFDAVLLFPGLEAFEEMEGFPISMDPVTNLLKLGNVGFIRRDAVKGAMTWEIRFGSRRYFHGVHGRGYFAADGLKYIVGFTQRPRPKRRRAR